MAFPELDLPGISMDAPELATPARNVVADDDDGILEPWPLPKVDDGLVLAQPAITPVAPVSKTPVLTIDADGTLSKKDGGTPADALNV